MAHKENEHSHGEDKSSSQVEYLRGMGESGASLLEASLYSKLRDPATSTRLRSPMLLGLSRTLGAACVEYNAAFYDCKARTNNPEKCINEGALVNRCADNVWQLVRERCLRKFQAYSECLNQNNLEFRHCRDAQKTFDFCIAQADPALGKAVEAWGDVPKNP